MKTLNSENSLKTLRKTILQRDKSVPREQLDAAAHMLLYLDEPQRVLEIALNYLVDKTNVCRGDAGLANVSDTIYTAQASYESQDRYVPSMLGVSLPNQHKLIQNLWHQHKDMIAIENVKHFAGMGALNDVLLPLNTQSILATKLNYQDENLGLICLDYTVEQHRWEGKEKEVFYSFTQNYLSPILYYSKRKKAKESPNPLSEAELEAVRLAAKGLSYKAIAKSLGKSNRTIDNQLRSARAKLDAKNQIELIQSAQSYL